MEFKERREVDDVVTRWKEWLFKRNLLRRTVT